MLLGMDSTVDGLVAVRGVCGTKLVCLVKVSMLTTDPIPFSTIETFTDGFCWCLLGHWVNGIVVSVSIAQSLGIGIPHFAG